MRMSVKIKSECQVEWRCPSCHDDLAPAEADLCERCGTPHHEDCLADGGCAAAGCGWAPVEPGWYADDGNATVYFEDADSGEEAAERYVADGDWGEVEETIWIHVQTWRQTVAGKVIEDTEESHSVEVDPDEPECPASVGGDHDWRSPHALVGGIEENPGCWGHGGGVQYTEVCVRCGCAKHTDTWAQDPATGAQGLTSTRYEEGEVNFGRLADYWRGEDDRPTDLRGDSDLARLLEDEDEDEEVTR